MASATISSASAALCGCQPAGIVTSAKRPHEVGQRCVCLQEVVYSAVLQILQRQLTDGRDGFLPMVPYTILPGYNAMEQSQGGTAVRCMRHCAHQLNYGASDAASARCTPWADARGYCPWGQCCWYVRDRRDSCMGPRLLGGRSSFAM